MDLILNNDNNKINSNQKLILPTFLIGLVGILVVLIYNSAFKKGKFTCKKYILNTYLYILLTLVLMVLLNLSLDEEKVPPNIFFGQSNGLMGLLIGLFVTVGLLILLMLISPKRVLIKHAVWLLFTCVLAVLAYPTYIITKESNTVLKTLFGTIGILILFSVMAFWKPELISLSWGTGLVFVLLAVIIFEFVNILFSIDKKGRIKYRRSKPLSYIVIVIFTLFILYDTKVIQVAAKKCKTSNVDYINQSLGIVLDVLNIFQNIGNIQQ